MRATKLLGYMVLRLALVVAGAAAMLLTSVPAMAENGNRLLGVTAEPAGDQTVVTIATAAPIGYRYTVYDSLDPLRVIVDFRGMEVAGVPSPVNVAADPVAEIRTSSFDLTSGKLGRVEILLAAPATYDVALADTSLTLTLRRETPSTQAAAAPAEPLVAVAEPMAPAASPADIAPAPVAASAIPASEAPSAAGAPLAAASAVSAVGVEEGRVVFQGDGAFGKVRYFGLEKPNRLVIDLYDVKATFKQDVYPLRGAFKQLRVGRGYKDKVRFVLDAAGALPEYDVASSGDALVLRWGQGLAQPLAAKAAVATPASQTAAPAPTRSENVPAGATIAVRAIDFYQEGETSVLAVTLSGDYALIDPQVDGEVVRFGVRNASIARELRRVIDSSAFPSSVRMVTPYTVQRGKQQDVYFAAELKGQVPYRVARDGARLLFVADNGAFSEASPAPLELREVAVVAAPAKTTAPAAAPKPAAAAQRPADVSPAAAVPASDLVGLSGRPIVSSGYTGQRISLVFDNADIRNVLQLIADVSQLNIIATDEVKGNLSIRLIDVPWDQALDIVLDIKDLGKIQIDNVVRILPKDRIREMESAEMNAAKNKRDIAPLVTRVMPISYSNLASISGPVKELLSERGKVTQDARNKQIIVTDVEEILAEVAKLVAILDTPERQVMIEARIVEATTTFARDLGVKWGLTWRNQQAESGDLSSTAIGGGGSFILPPPGVGGVGAAGLASDFVFGRVGVDSTILDLRLSALESSGNGKIISTPRVTTLNGKPAVISQGTKIPYQTQGDDGPETQFESAELKLEVTPEINPDNSIILDIKASNSSQGAIVPTGLGSAPSIDDKKAETTVLVRDGETTVIGGIFVESASDGEVGVPLLMHIPVLGHLFKSTSKTTERRELLIFVTPRILNN